ncbi:MAG: SIS domain-containing protein [Chloroflexi bacterium]|nr:SIS domain-containing protein [Chloroflexota bacterium]
MNTSTPTPDATTIETYLAGLGRTLTALPREPLLQILATLRQARTEGRRVFIFGNGGSAATGSHMACDFGKNTVRGGRPRLRVIALNDNMPTFSAYANDEGYDRVFAEPLATLAEAGDVAIAISGSGNSPNVLRAVEVGRGLGLTTIGLTGFAGGKLVNLVDICLVVPSDSMEQVEDAHMVIDHVLTVALREN